jgi:hypothetical protein
MKKFLYLTLLLSIGFLTQCKKNSDIVVLPGPGTGTKPDPEVEVPPLIKADEFLKMLSVTGAEKVVFDSVRNFYMVSLPDSYDESKAEVKLSLQKNIVLWDSTATSITKDSVIRYSYKGTAPLAFKLSDNPEKSWLYFTVFFNFSGIPKVELLSKEIPMDVTGSILPLRFVAKVGSIPASPDHFETVVKVTNRKTGFTAESFLYAGGYYVNFPESEKLITNDPFSLEINLYNQKPVVFEGVKFIRGIPKLNLGLAYKFIYNKQDTIKGAGGFFIPNAKYSATFTNDYISAPVKAGVRFNDASKLTIDQIPANLPEGSYLVTVYEEEKLLGKSAILVSPTEVNYIESIWKGSINSAQDRNVSKLSYIKGDTFFAKSTPLTYGYGNATNLDPKQLSTIRLKNAEKSYNLKPELAIYYWAIAGVSYGVGKYTITADIAPGSYEVTALSSDGKETKPYWSKLQVR